MKHDLLLSEPCTACGAPVGAACIPVASADLLEERRQRNLYYYAVSRALSALMGYAQAHGRGWYHFVAGDLIARTEILLS